MVLEDAHTEIDCLIYPVSVAAVRGLPSIDGGDWVEYRVSRA